MTLEITLGNAPVQDALEEARNLTRLGYPAPPDFARANALLNPLGEQPGRGWFLLLRQDLDKLNLNGLLTLALTDGYGNSVSVPNLVVCREPTCLTPSMTDNDPLACYLVEVADARWRCHNPYYSIALNAQYNVRAPGWGGMYYQASTNAGTPWTWAGMIGDIWGTMAAQLGAFPGLPASVSLDGQPEHYRFLGVSAWRSLCQVLDKLGMAVAWNAAKGTYSIVAIGASDNATQRLLNAAAGRLIHDHAYLTVVRGRVPASVLVHFHATQDRGTEAITEQDASQFVSNAVYTVAVAGTAAQTQGAEPGVQHPLWDDLPAVYDANGTLTNAAALATRAQTRATAFYNQIQGNGGGRLNQTYTGLVAVAPGATIRGVVWRQDRQSLTDPGGEGGGIVTEIVRTPWTALRVADRGQLEPALADSTALRPPDYRIKEPSYPDLLQTVRVTSSSPTNGLYPAVVEGYDTDTATWGDRETCNVLPANGETLSGQRYTARLLGYASGAPLYVVSGLPQGKRTI